MKVSVVTPSVRPEMLEIVAKCLNRQTFTEWEWLIGSPQNLFIPIDRQIGHDYEFTFVPDPPKKENIFYSLNASWNNMFKVAKGELIVSIVDGLWFPPNTLQVLWDHYERDSMSCISLTGDQFDQIENGKPEHRVWIDPRRKGPSLYEIPPHDLELCIASLPLKGIKDVGGVDEQWDKYPAWSEKDLACRMAQIGYKCFIDESVEYRAIHHPRLQGSKWDKIYPQSTEYFRKCYNEIRAGKRLKLAFLDEK